MKAKMKIYPNMEGKDCANLISINHKNSCHQNKSIKTMGCVISNISPDNEEGSKLQGSKKLVLSYKK
jgi:hypothetical protein